MKVTINADTQTLIKFWLVPLGIVVAGFALYSARTALIILGTALFMALVLNTPVSKLAQFLPGKSRVGGTAIAFVSVVAFLTAFVTLVIPPIVQQTSKFVDTVPGLVDSLSVQYEGVNQLVERYHLQPQVDEAVESLRSNASGLITGFGANVVGSVTSVVSFFIAFTLTLVLTFLMLIEGPTMLRKLWQLYDDAPRMERHRNLATKMYHVVNGYVVGQLTIAGIGAVVMSLLVFILSFLFEIPSNLAIPAAAIYFVLTLIPMFGSTIAALLIGLLLILNSFWAAISFAVIYIIYQQIENNVIGPIVQSRTLSLTALWILTAVTIGIYVFGLVGGIISIPIAGCLKVLFDDYLVHQKRQRDKTDQPLARLARKVKKA